MRRRGKDLVPEPEPIRVVQEREIRYRVGFLPATRAAQHDSSLMFPISSYMPRCPAVLSRWGDIRDNGTENRIYCTLHEGHRDPHRGVNLKGEEEQWT